MDVTIWDSATDVTMREGESIAHDTQLIKIFLIQNSEIQAQTSPEGCLKYTEGASLECGHSEITRY